MAANWQPKLFVAMKRSTKAEEILIFCIKLLIIKVNKTL
jgi:hypothetical protein